jgi:cell division protein FtsB
MPHAARHPSRPRRRPALAPRERPAQQALPFPGHGRTDVPPVRRVEDRPWQRRHLARLLVSLLTAILIANALVGDRGLSATLRARREHRALEAAIAALRAANERLQLETRRLRHDPAAIEDLARRELGLVRPGERLFIVKDLRAPLPVDDQPPRPRLAASEPRARVLLASD